MTAKQRIAKAEREHKAKNGTPEQKVIFMTDAYGDELAEFDGVKMTQAEAEAKAAALPDEVLLVRVTYASKDISSDV